MNLGESISLAALIAGLSGVIVAALNFRYQASKGYVERLREEVERLRSEVEDCQRDRAVLRADNYRLMARVFGSGEHKLE